MQQIKIKIYFTCGLIFLVLAIIGMIIPLLPTTPLALLAIYCFDRSSKKFHAWCLKIPGFGQGINDWNKHRVISVKAKVQASILLVASGVYIYLKSALAMPFKVLLIIILSSVMVFVLTRSSTRDNGL